MIEYTQHCVHPLGILWHMRLDLCRSKNGLGSHEVHMSLSCTTTEVPVQFAAHSRWSSKKVTLNVAIHMPTVTSVVRR